MRFIILGRPAEMPGGTARPVREIEYTVQAKTVATDPVTHMPLPTNQKRIAAAFTGIPPVFDSELAQRANGWTDDETERVERHLIQHKDFGRGMYPYPGEEIPEKYADIAPPSTMPTPAPRKAEDGKCKFLVTQLPPEVCGDDVFANSLCQRHWQEVTAAEAAEEKPKPAPKRTQKGDKDEAEKVSA